MSKSRGGLGRGLASLIPSGPASPINDVIIGGTARSGSPTSAAAEAVKQVEQGEPPVSQTIDAEAPPTADPAGPHYLEIAVDSIRPNPSNPRTIFDEEALAELEHSLREFGLLQPIVVRKAETGYELIMGERRWRAAQRAGLTHIPAIVRRTEDADLLRDALLENIHRANLNPLEEAAAYQQLLQEFNVTHEELATKLGRSRPVISNTIRLLKLPVAVQRRVAAGILSAGHARALLSLDESTAQEELATRIIAEGLSVRGTEEAVTMMAGRKTPAKRPAPKKLIMPGLNELATNLSDTFDTRVRVELGRKKGRIVVEFATVDDLGRIISIMAPKAARRGQQGKSDT